MQGIKGNRDQTATSRALRILYELMNNPWPVTQRQLAEELGCSRSTVHRTMLTLERQFAGDLILGKDGRELTYRMRKERYAGLLSLDADGLGKLALCWKLVCHTFPECQRAGSRQVLEQVMTLCSSDDGAPLRFVDHATVFTKGHVDYSGYDDVFSALKQAIMGDLVVDVTYARCRGKPPRTYPVAPKRLVQFNGIWYVLCWPVTDDDPVRLRHDGSMSLLIHRIKRIVLTERSSGCLDGIDINQDTFGFMMGETPFVVRAVVRGAGPAGYVADRIWAADQVVRDVGEDAIEISFTATSRGEVRSWILALGRDAELLEPVDLRDAIRDELLEMAARASERAGEEK